jgi:hypothetical protein
VAPAAERTGLAAVDEAEVDDVDRDLGVEYGAQALGHLVEVETAVLRELAVPSRCVEAEGVRLGPVDAHEQARGRLDGEAPAELLNDDDLLALAEDGTLAARDQDRRAGAPELDRAAGGAGPAHG